MNKPIQFITIDKEGRCTLTKEAENLIRSIETNVAVICIAGIYRSGKSYLLNRLLGRQDGFEIGPTIASCTKGIWIWGNPIKIESRNMHVLIIDTEGLASAFDDRNESIDMVIFSLALLMSSLFIYNSMKCIDESAIENLALVLNFAKKIQSKFKEVNNYANNFPSFLWVLRDFALELIDAHGNNITATQYLENALKEDNGLMSSVSSLNSFNKGVSEEIAKKNEIRSTLKLFFKERDCFTLVRPVNEEKKLKIIDKLPTDELRPEFLAQMKELVKRVFDSVRPKQVQGSYMNGEMFVTLIKMYITALNSNSLPDVKTSWKIVVDQQMEATFQKSFNYYIEEMLGLDYKKFLHFEDLIRKHNELKEIAIDYLQEYAMLNIPLSVCLEFYKKIEAKINEQFWDFVVKWKEISSNQCQELATQLIQEYKNNPELSEIFACLDTIEDVLKFIDEANVNEKKYEIMYPQIIQYFVDFLKKGVKENKAKTEEEKTKLKHENTVLQGIVDKTKEMLESTRETYDKQVSELKEENLENRIDLEARLDEKSKAIQSLQTANEDTVDELKNKIIELTAVIETNKELQKEPSKKSKAKKKAPADDTVLDYKLDSILERIDNIKSVMFKSEVEKVKNQMLTEMDLKYDTVQEEFRGKLKTAKKNCERALTRLKLSKDSEINKLKQIIKDLNDEIQDYKSQVDSQEYKISLYKEKIINYEKEKKAQTDHAELLKVLAVKLNNYVSALSTSKNSSK